MEEQKKKRIKYGGRKKGTPNKTTSNTRKWLESIVEMSAKSIEEDLPNMLPKDRCDFIAKILPYIVAKKTEITASASLDFDSMSEEQLNEIISRITAKDGEGEAEVTPID